MKKSVKITLDQGIRLSEDIASTKATIAYATALRQMAGRQLDEAEKKRIEALAKHEALGVPSDKEITIDFDDISDEKLVTVSWEEPDEKQVSPAPA